MAIVYPCGTDYSTPCGNLPPTFIQMLASILVYYPCDLAGTPQARLNLLPQYGDCDSLSNFWTCANQGMTSEAAERALVENAFAVDACGRLGLKVYVNTGERQ